jgi:site-specific DNA-cytosine methylase
MGFDSLGRPRFKIPVSDTQAYKQFGNSVVVPVIRAIASALMCGAIAEAAVDANQLGLELA